MLRRVQYNLPLEVPAFRAITFPPKDLPNDFFPVRVDRVIDGDSVWMWIDLKFDGMMAHRNCRLLGIQAPDKQPAKGDAKAVLSVWLYPLANAVAYIPAMDKYGRPLVAVYVPGMDISLNQYLLDTGNAVPYDGQSPKPDTEKR